jgi:hypothetical protein
MASKTPRLVNVTIHNVTGDGATRAEAKADAEAKLDALVRGSYNPVVIIYRGWTGLVYREPSGWCARTIAPGSVGIQRPGGTCCYGDDLADALARTALHIFTLGWDHGDPVGYVPPELPAGLAKEFKTNAGFQRAYQHAKLERLGTNDYQWHIWACDNCRDPRFYGPTD